jgi:hypothetical protein
MMPGWSDAQAEEFFSKMPQKVYWHDRPQVG